MHNLHIEQSIVSRLKEFALVFDKDGKCHPFTVFTDVQTKQQLWHSTKEAWGEINTQITFYSIPRTLFADEKVCNWFVSYHISGSCLIIPSFFFFFHYYKNIMTQRWTNKYYERFIMQVVGGGSVLKD